MRILVVDDEEETRELVGHAFALRELLARVRAVGRRGPVLHPRLLPLGALTVDFDARRAIAKDRELPITNRSPVTGNSTRMKSRTPSRTANHP